MRTHWQIENGLHYRRDETLREDWCHLRLGQAAHMMAAINNLALGVLLRRVCEKCAKRVDTLHLNDVVALVLRC